MVAFWDTTAGYTDRGIGDKVVDVGPVRAARRGLQPPGSRADRLELERPQRLLPSGAAGIWRHRVPLRRDHRLQLGARPRSIVRAGSLKSGAYAMRLRAGDGNGLAKEYIVFFVRPASAEGPLAFSCADRQLSRLCQRASELRRPDHAADDRPAADRVRDRHRDVQEPRIRTVDLRRHGKTAPASATPPTAGRSSTCGPSTASPAWAFPGSFPPIFRSSPGWSTRATTTTSSPTRTCIVEGVGGLKPYKCVMSRHAPGILFRRDARCDRGLHRRGRPLHLYGRQRLLLERRVSRGRACRHGSAQAQFRHARLECAAGRALSRDHRPEERPVEEPRPAAAEAGRRRLHRRGLRDEPGPTGACPTAITGPFRGSWRVSRAK